MSTSTHTRARFWTLTRINWHTHKTRGPRVFLLLFPRLSPLRPQVAHLSWHVSVCVCVNWKVMLRQEVVTRIEQLVHRYFWVILGAFMVLFMWRSKTHLSPPAHYTAGLHFLRSVMQCGREEIRRLTVPRSNLCLLGCEARVRTWEGDISVYPACRQRLRRSAEREGSSVMQYNAMQHIVT